MRRCLRVLSSVWLACQLVAVVAPLTLVNDRFGIDPASCCPGIGPGQVCPMHHHTAGDRSTCKMERECAHADSALLTILAVGTMPPARTALASVNHTEFVSPIAASSQSRAVVPDAPPPRVIA